MRCVQNCSAIHHGLRHRCMSHYQVCSAAVEPNLLFAGAVSEEPLVDLEGLQFESAAEGTVVCV